MNSSQRMVRPNIPRDCYQPDFVMFLLFLTYSAGMLVGFGLLSYQVYISEIHILIKFPILLVTIFLTSNGIHLIGLFAHDGIHLSLLKNKYASIITGTLLGSAVTFPTIGYGITHWTHHRYTNQKSDPDTKIYSKYKTFLSRFFLSRLVANRGYFKNTFRLIFNIPLEKHHPMPFSPLETRLLALLSILSMVAFIAIYIYIGLINPTYAIIAMVIPYILSIPITGLRIYVEHTGTGCGVFRDTRTYSSRFYTVLLFGNNFHLEHHLYPMVPCYKLPKVHSILKKGNYFEEWDSYVTSGIFAPLKYATGKYQYPEALSKNEKANPFDINNRPTADTIHVSPAK